MPTTTTAPQSAASSAVDEAIRIAADGSRRTAESARAAVQATRTYFDQVNQVSAELFKIWASTADAALQSAFDYQNAAFANGQAGFETWAGLSKDRSGRLRAALSVSGIQHTPQTKSREWPNGRGERHQLSVWEPRARLAFRSLA